jgi:hypothetical protein
VEIRGTQAVKEFDILGFVKHIAALEVALPMAEHSALEHAAVIVEKEAKDVIGTYRYDWPELAESTQTQRVQLGFSANEPGLRTGEMRDSIEHVVGHKEAHVGSNDERLLWFELGTSRQPPRSVLAEAAMHKGEEVSHVIGRSMHAHLIGDKS